MILLIALSACRPSPPANPEFNDAATFALREFEADDPVNLAFAVRTVESSVLADIDLDAGVLDRSRTPDALTADDTASFPVTPDLDPSACLGVSVAHLSAFGVDDHVRVQLLDDQTPIEPASEDKYDRVINEGADCFADRSCDVLRTENAVLKINSFMELDYTLWKDVRWVDLNLPDPADVPEGQVAENTGEERWALVGRSWISEPAVSETDDGSATIQQSYSLEVWVPNDDGTLRMMALWSETQFNGSVDPGDDAVVGITRSGIQGIFDAGDDWIDEN
jgi:hypothetical protein